MSYVGKLLAEEGKRLSMIGSNGKPIGRNIGLESLGFAVAEGVSMLTALGVVACADQVAPKIVNGTADVLANTVVLPLLDPIEHTLDRACKLEECKRDPDVPREERAKHLAKTLVVFGASWATAMIFKIETRRYMNRSFDIPSDTRPDAKWWEFWKLSRKEFMILAADEGVHYGALGLLNTSAAHTTDQVIRSTRNMLMKCGVPEDKAQELSAYTMIWEMPNFLGLLAGLGAIYATHKYPGPLGIKPPGH